MKTSVSKVKKNVRAFVVIYYADTWFSNFAIEYLRENENLVTLFSLTYCLGELNSMPSLRQYAKSETQLDPDTGFLNPILYYSHLVDF